MITHKGLDTLDLTPSLLPHLVSCITSGHQQASKDVLVVSKENTIDATSYDHTCHSPSCCHAITRGYVTLGDYVNDLSLMIQLLLLNQQIIIFKVTSDISQFIQFYRKQRDLSSLTQDVTYVSIIIVLGSGIVMLQLLILQVQAILR